MQDMPKMELLVREYCELIQLFQSNLYTYASKALHKDKMKNSIVF